MNPLTRTLVFVGVAAVSASVAVATYVVHRPADLEAFSDVGELFYPSFSDPNEATGLRVAKYDPDAARTELFGVEFRDGLWRIPSHHGYPADGEEMLSKTAASMIGVRRSALVERTAEAHRRHDLLDPLDEEVSGAGGRGTRITLLKGDQPLVDFIVGRKVEGEENTYFVRRADEDRFYTADLGSFSISTKFVDWIEKNVLDVERNSIVKLFINRYFVDEAAGRVKSEGVSQLDREAPGGSWTLADLDSETETLKTTEVNALLSAIQDLKIVGVRPKPPGLRDSLHTDGAIDPRAARDLLARGFYIHQGRLYANEGEVNVGTNEGVVYTLAFGEEFTGGDLEIEVGSAAARAAADPAEEPMEDQPENAASDEAPPRDDADETEQPDSPAPRASRYLFVTVQYDPQLIGPPPEAPVKPTPPENPPAAPAETPDAPAPEADAPAEPQPNAETPAAPETPAADPQADYQTALKQYEEALEVYEIRKKDYEEKLKKGEERVAELNRRFADWYYVISEDVFTRLKLRREELVEAKQPEPSAEESPEEGLPPAATPPDDAPAPDAAPPEEPSAPDAAPQSEPAPEAAPDTPSEEAGQSADGSAADEPGPVEER